MVVTARNDDHGGDLLGRMQVFAGGWLAQARRHGIPSELIIVEWNPPEDRPRLKDALRWPDDFGPCEVRFIEVPPELHQRYAGGGALPLYQMIAKNAGIRRARGRFILATNIDILFSDELAAAFAEQRFEPGRMYRIDRHDVGSDVPVGAPLDEQLAYCRTHLIRLNTREGTFSVLPDGTTALNSPDVASPGSGILFGKGWFPTERLGPHEVFRWAGVRAEVLFGKAPGGVAALLVDLEPGPSAGGEPVDLEVTSGENRMVARVSIDSRSQLRLPLPTPPPERLWFRTYSRAAPFGVDPRVLNLRMFRFEWEPGTPGAGALGATVKRDRRLRRVATLWHALQHVLHKLATGGSLVSFSVPVPQRLQRLLKSYVEWGGVTGLVRHGLGFRMKRRGLKRPAPAPNHGPTGGRQCVADFLHTNACGDFTLMARDHWFDLRGYPEFDLFSMNLDSVLCFAAHYGGAREEMLTEPMRIYHVEHGSGSGWTPEGQAKLFARIAASGLSFIDNQDVLAWAAQMRRLNSPMIFNHREWGLSGFALKETILPRDLRGA